MIGGLYTIQQVKFQNYILPYITKSIEGVIESKVTIGKIEVKFFKRLVVSDLCVYDTKDDTLIYSRHAEVRIKRLNFDKKEVLLKSIFLDSANVQFRDIDEAGLNFKYFWDKIKSSGSNEKPIKLISDKLEIQNSKFSYLNGKPFFEEGEFNFSDFTLYQLLISTENFILDSGKLNFDIRDMSFQDKAGFSFQHFIARASISNKSIIFNDPYVETKHSIIIGDKIGFHSDSFDDYSDGGFLTKIQLDINLDPSNLNFRDIAFFSDPLDYYDQNFIFSGKLNGTVNNLKGKNISMQIGQSSSLQCNVYFNGLPDIQKTFIHADIRNLYANYNDINSIRLPGIDTTYIRLPNVIEKFGDIRYNGTFTGFVKDFFSYGKLSTSLGDIKTDLSLKPDTNNLLVLNGDVQCIDFNAGSFLGVKDLQNTSFKSSINGKVTRDSGFVANVIGDISSIEYNNYICKNIDVKTKISGSDVEGEMIFDDPNLKGNVKGVFKDLDSIPNIKFLANIENANLGKLNLVDSLYQLSFNLTTELTGSKPDLLNGSIDVVGLSFVNKNDSLNIGDINLNISEYGNDNKNIVFVSDFLEANLYGKFAITNLGKSFQNIVFQYIENLNKYDSLFYKTDTNIFNYEANFKNMSPLLSYFLPELAISNNTFLKGEFNPLKKNYDFHLISNYLIYEDIVVKGIQCNSKSIDSILSFNAGCEYLTNNKVRFDNLSVYVDLFSNKADVKLRWNNWDSTLYKGNIHVMANFNENTTNKNNFVEIELFPSTFVVKDTIWNVSKGSVLIDSTYLGFDDIEISNNNQVFSMNGAVSEDIEDSLFISFENFRLNNLNILLLENKTTIEGKLDGEISISDYYKDRLFFSWLNASDFKVNDIFLGNFKMESSWDKKKERIKFKALSKIGGSKSFDVSGYVEPESKEIYSDIKVNEFDLGFIQPYFSSVTSNVSGHGSGNAMLTGTITEPVLNGYVEAENVSVAIDYLGTYYTFSDKIEISNNDIILDKIRLKDKYNNQAFLSGTVRSTHLKDFNLDLAIITEKLLFLETTINDNPSFYGTAFASGNIEMVGPIENLKFAIRAKTKANTEFNVPLTTSVTVNDFNFIDYYPKLKKSEDELFILEQLSKNKQSSNLNINIDMEVTPDAQIQLIFDSKMGDVIKGRGQGNLKMQANSGGAFRMFGNVEVTEGDYLFTLQNVINKKFQIKRGGTIQWDGSPSEAILDLQAVYNLRTNIEPLFSQYISSAENTESQYDKVVPIECQLLLTDNLIAPTTSFGIELPASSEEIRGMVNNILNTEEELSKQFISLMIFKKFVEPTGDNPIFTKATSNQDALNVVGMELVSNQLSHWFSQFSDDLNVQIDYNTEQYDENELGEGDDAIKMRQVELVLSYQMLQNKVTINGEVDLTNQQGGEQNPNGTLIGDFDVDVKLTDNGKLRFKAFNREHTDMTEIDPYFTQGVGFFYREEFDTFKELMKRYSNAFAWRKEDKEEVVDEGEQDVQKK